MVSVEMIGRLQAGVGNLDCTPRGTSKEHLSKAELAGLLAGLSDAEMALALAKYGCDDGAKRSFLIHVIGYVSALALKENWQPRCRDVLNAIATMAVHEVMSDNLCPRCHGIGLLDIKVCHSCNGTKHKRLSGREMSMKLNISDRQWRRDWVVRYDDVYRYVNELDGNIKRHFFKS